MLACPETPSDTGDDVVMQAYLTKSDLRGCSDFLFVPGTNDTHVFMLRTEESLDNIVSTYASVIDLQVGAPTHNSLPLPLLPGSQRRRTRS